MKKFRACSRAEGDSRSDAGTTATWCVDPTREALMINMQWTMIEPAG